SILKTLSESKNRINNEGAKEILSSLLMYETLKKYKEHQKPMNLLLYGKSGSGKTFLVEQLLKSIEKKYIFTDMKLYSDVGYQGKDVISIFEDFLANENYNLESVENGIIVFDEFDKIQTKETNMKDITGLSIQHSLLKIMDGTTLNLPNKSGKRTMGSHININTSNMTFIFIGAFSYLEDYHNLHQKLASNGFTVELINRFSNIIKIKELDKNDIMKFLNINNSQSPFHY
ncbi:AAA family ATPase, partial [Mammaliicoccus sciuri]|uniref:AAA family ATPase n=1 Tax=Mammaliicoccus sciuri TaxID=1296 RepID=UPI000D1F8549